MNKSESKKILAWSLHLGDYSFVIEHIPGKDNVVADALSRLFEINQEVKDGKKESEWLQEEVQKVITIVNKSRYIQRKDAATTPIEQTAMHAFFVKEFTTANFFKDALRLNFTQLFVHPAHNLKAYCDDFSTRCALSLSLYLLFYRFIPLTTQ